MQRPSDDISTVSDLYLAVVNVRSCNRACRMSEGFGIGAVCSRVKILSDYWGVDKSRCSRKDGKYWDPLV